MMKWIKGFAMLSLILLIAAVWLLLLYLNSKTEATYLKQRLEMKQPAKQTAERPAVDVEIQAIATSFCRELYQENPSAAVLAAYTTEQAKALVVPPQGAKAKSKIDRKIVLHEVQLYEGQIKGKSASIIAGVKRTVTISGVSTTSIAYIRLSLQKGKDWRVKDLNLLGEMPAR